MKKIKKGQIYYSPVLDKLIEIDLRFDTNRWLYAWEGVRNILEDRIKRDMVYIGEVYPVYTKKEINKILGDASEMNPYSSFIASCKEFYKKRKYLTERQIEVLMDIGEPSKVSWSSWDDQDDDFFTRDYWWIPNQT